MIPTNRLIKMLLPATLALLVALWTPPVASAGDTLAQIKCRGTLRCGVSEGIVGFSAKDAAGR